jgi:hypothetical protein
MIKAISLWEPWATLIALGKKRYETRSWKTFYRGPLLICAAKKKLPFIEIASLLHSFQLTIDDLHYGRAIAIVDLAVIFTTDYIHDAIDAIEKKVGDFSSGRYAWKLDNVRKFEKPPWIRGKQGLFDAPDIYMGMNFVKPLYNLPAGA